MPFTPEAASDLIRRTISALAGDDVVNKMTRSIESVWTCAASRDRKLSRQLQVQRD